METEITEFKPSRNDIALLAILIVVIAFKLIYIIRLYAVVGDLPFDVVISCIGKKRVSYQFKADFKRPCPCMSSDFHFEYLFIRP